MAHVTFIHGLSNKPEADALHRIWRRALGKGGDGIDLGSAGVSSRMVYWADVLYDKPDPNVAEHESVGSIRPGANDGGGDAELPSPQSDAEAQFLASARARMTALADADIEAAKAVEVKADPTKLESLADVDPLQADVAAKLERIPLPWFVKERIMKAYIRDAYLYLFDKSHSPRPGTTYKVREEIRNRTLAALSDPSITGPHVVVSHSMGTMIAYDCLKRVPACANVDALITLGSPLGVDEVQDKFAPEWSREKGYPGERIGVEWVNLYDRLDVVCAADPKLAGDYRHAGAEKIRDIEVKNDGAWRHSMVKYLARRQLRDVLRRHLGLEAP